MVVLDCYNTTFGTIRWPWHYTSCPAHTLRKLQRIAELGRFALSRISNVAAGTGRIDNLCDCVGEHSCDLSSPFFRLERDEHTGSQIDSSGNPDDWKRDSWSRP